MFRQVHLHNKDRDVYRFVFRGSPGDESKDFQWRLNSPAVLSAIPKICEKLKLFKNSILQETVTKSLSEESDMPGKETKEMKITSMNLLHNPPEDH